MPRATTLLLVMLSLGLTCCPIATRGASITYNIQSYAAFQHGYTLSGTITTDGTLGFLATNNIVNWSYTISLGGTVEDQGSGQGNNTEVQGLQATATQLTLAHSIGLSFFALNPRLPSIGWTQYGPEQFYEAGKKSQADLWLTNVAYPTLPLPTADTWIIATTAVPEPGTLTLALLGIACLAVAAWTRRRSRAARSPLALPTSLP